MFLSHVNINTPDWKKLVQFYIDVFGFKLIPPIRDYHDEFLEIVSGMKDAGEQGAHIALPGYEMTGPTIEIFTHDIQTGTSSTQFNQKGFGHIGITVDSVEEVYELFEKLQQHGGNADGRIAQRYNPAMDKTLTLVFAKDPDGNIVEILNWQNGKKLSGG